MKATPVTGLFALGVLAAPACGGGAEVPAVVEVEVPVGSGIDLRNLEAQPADRVREVAPLAGGRAALRVVRPGAEGTLTLTHPEACPVTVDLGALDPGGRVEVRLVPFIDLGPPIAQAGFDSPLELEVTPGCREAVAGRITWRLESGPDLRDRTTRRNGFALSGRTVPRETLLPDPLPWGIVPISPRTRGETVLSATWEGASRGPVRREVRVAAAARAGGVPSVPPGQRLLLGGAGWRVLEAPPGGSAQVQAAGGAAALRPDAIGRWLLADGVGEELMLRVGRHDHTPLDCGRSDCHAGAAEGVAPTRMTTVFMRGLSGGLGPDYDPGCALACHTVGEPGLPDGGFSHVARSLGFGFDGTPRPTHDALPAPLRRLGGVGCTACHGPGAIPTPASRWTILRTEVCAVCHDSPPRYGHVAAWGASSMARTDAEPARREEPCAGCHTTSGFLARIGVRDGVLRVDPPAFAAPVGITCAACHAVHSEGTGTALLRYVRLPPHYAEVPHADRAGICVACHAPLGDGAPAASEAALWLGRSARAVNGGGPLRPEVAPVHAEVEGGCVGCHAAAPPGLGVERGAGHAFATDAARCAPCHEEGVPDDPTLALHARARSLLAGLGVALEGDGSPHASPPAMPEDPARGRAAFDLLLVLEDGAAGVHGPRFAAHLLDTVEADLAAASDAMGSGSAGASGR